MTEKPWDFERWFVLQHGPRPTDLDENLLRDATKSRSVLLANDQQLLLRLEFWESSRTSALYAWNIRDSEKAKP